MAVYYATNGGEPAPVWNCAAIIIDKKYALTSAYCISPPSFQGSDGNTYYLAGTTIYGGLHTFDEQEGVDLLISGGFIKHESFQEETPVAGSDIAIILLHQDYPEFNFASAARMGPVCMPALNEVFDTGTTVQISGWGYTDNEGTPTSILQQASSNLIDNSQCQSQLGSETGGTITDSQLCILSNEGAAVCKGGDIGGPVTTVVNGRAKLVGILSYGSYTDGATCSKPNVPYAMTRVAAYMDWIEANTPDRTCF